MMALRNKVITLHSQGGNKCLHVTDAWNISVKENNKQVNVMH